MTSLGQLAGELKQLRSAILCTHISPDPDAIGSTFALQRALAQLGISTTVHLPESVPMIMGELTKQMPFVLDVPQGPVDALIALDTAAKSRAAVSGSEIFSRSGKTINIDHHFSNELWADINFVDSSASASSVIVAELIPLLGASIDAATATLLLAGLMDDTGSFCFSNTDARSFECAANLVRCGAVAEEVANQLFFSLPERVLRLRAEVMQGLTLRCGGKIAVISVTRELMDRLGATIEDTDGLVDEARTLNGTLGVVLLREMDDGKWRVSIRSKDQRLDANAVCGVFGGGGHRAAAGFKIHGLLTEIESKILAAIESALG